MVPTNILQRVYRLKYRDSVGTCFTVEVDDRQYIITAKHVLLNIQNDEEINIFHENQWKQLKIQIIGIGEQAIDIIVLAANFQLSPHHHLEPSSAGIFLAQDVYFLGFPYDITINTDPNINYNFPLPLVKKGIISGINHENRMRYMLIDGLNNPGFSGGPVYGKIVGGKNDHRVIAVISGFRFEWEPVYLNKKQISVEYKFNTGIIIAYTIENAVELIEKNPIGFPLKS